jgi:hypothetical protein
MLLPTLLLQLLISLLLSAAMEGVEESKSSTTGSTAVSREEALQRVTKAVELLSKQTVGGNGGTAMKTVLVYVSNILAKPEEDKFRNIRLENAAFKVYMHASTINKTSSYVLHCVHNDCACRC